MYYNIHTQFIQTSISNILDDGITSCSCIESGIESIPLCDYVMKTMFLNMTGAQEQKLRCLCWEMATNDYTYRRDFINNKNNGEYSNFSAKCRVYKDLLEQIRKYDTNFNVRTHITNQILTDIYNYFNKKVKSSILDMWLHNQYLYFEKNYSKLFTPKQLSTNSTLLETVLSKYYDEYVYKFRNQCAHNTWSYQQYLPTLDAISNKDYEKNNYFFRFAIILLIDKIFIVIYDEFLKLRQKNIYFNAQTGL